MMLEVRALDVLLGDYQVLWGARLSVAAGEIVALLGPNGAGKSTLMNAVSGLVRPRAGEIRFENRSIAGHPAHRVVGEGIGHVLERRRLFPYLTVRQNVWLGGYHPAARAGRETQLARVTEQPGQIPDASGMLRQLLADHETVIRQLREDAVKVNDAHADLGTSDFLTGLMEDHEKMAWMLRAFLSTAA